MPKNWWGLTLYHRLVLLGYLFFVLYIVFFSPQILVFTLSLRDVYFFAAVVVGTLVLAKGINAVIHLVTFRRSATPIFQVIVLSLLFSFPEELLFRGVIQASFARFFSSTLLVILFSALLFGLAHLPNGATGFTPKKWNWVFAGIAGIGGLPLATLFAATHSLLFPTVLHFLFLFFAQLLITSNPARLSRQ